jgi:hypothetical protein
MKNKIIYIFLVVICYFFYGCNDVRTNHKLSLTNKSDKKVSILYSNLVDKILTENNVAYYISDWNVIKPDSTYDIVKLGGKDAWHNFIEKSKTKKLLIYVFESDTLKKYDGVYSMEDIVGYHKYLKLLLYSEKDLDKIDWQITFK